MNEATDGSRAPLSHTRQVTIDALCEHFANDVMSVEEFERRVDTAHQAQSTAELEELLRDLPGSTNLPATASESKTPVVSGDYQVATHPSDKERELVIAVMGGATRSGRWRPARKNISIAMMGGAEIDFREAIMNPGVTELQIYTMWGGVDVIVPPGMNVECHGIALMAGFEHKADQLESPDPSAPTLRITGVAVMAGVSVTVRHSGESAGDARRRRRLERRQRRKQLRGG